MHDLMRVRILQALDDLRMTDYDYYDGQSVWCRFCRNTRPSVDRDTDLTWHDNLCIFRVAHETYEFDPAAPEPERPPIKGFKRISK